MSVSSAQNSTLETISSSYQSSAASTSETESYLGREEFLTMLVAQLQNQDPLNPMEGTDFSSQLAEFSQLEQLMNLNDSMETFATAFESQSGGNLSDYIDKQVTGDVNSMQVSDGAVSGGFYNLSALANVIIDVTDADGKIVKRLYPGQQDPGAKVISWDGTDSAGEAVEDGTYYYSVYADTGSGYETISTSVTGTVDGISYVDGEPYLVVQGVLMSPDALTAVTNATAETDDAAVSILDYLGTDIGSDAPILLVEDDALLGGDLTFELEDAEDVTITIYDPFDEEVQSISVAAADLQAGENSVAWDGLANTGYHVADGLYYYTVQTASGGFAETPVSGEVSGIKYVNSSQYLVLDNSGRLVALSAIKEINQSTGTTP